MNTSADMQEAFRLTELLQLSILDTPPEPEYDALVQLAGTLFGCAISTVTLVDTARQWFKAKVGVYANETPRSISICQYTIQSSRPLLITDTHRDPRVLNSPLVQGAPYLRAYLGIPIQSVNQARIGTFCVMDTAPRIWTEHEVQLARQLAKMAEMLIQKHETVRSQIAYQRSHTSKTSNAPRPRGAWDWTPGQSHVRLSADLRRTFGLPLDMPVHAHVFASLGIERSWMHSYAKLKQGLHSRVEYEYLRVDGQSVHLREEIHVIESAQGLKVCGLIDVIEEQIETSTPISKTHAGTWQEHNTEVQSALECLGQHPCGYLVVDENQWVKSHLDHLNDNRARPLLPIRLDRCFDKADVDKVMGEWVAAKMGLRTQSIFVRNIASGSHGDWLKIKPLPSNKQHSKNGQLLIRYTRLQELSPQH